jgi:hypothetical protein
MSVSMTVDSSTLTGMSQTALDQLFVRGQVGRVPVGDAVGTAIVVPGSPVSGLLAALIRLLAWQGKVFDPDGRGLRNKISPFGIRAIRAAVYKEPSWFDRSECIVLDYSKTSFVARLIRDEIREVAPGRFLGIVYWGKRKIANFFLVFAS